MNALNEHVKCLTHSGLCVDAASSAMVARKVDNVIVLSANKFRCSIAKR